MKFFNKFFCLGALICISCFSRPAVANDQAQYHELVKSVYNFSPQELNDSEIEKVSRELDEFWKSQTNQKSKILSLLRYELNTKGHKPFFYFDGASLLMSLSKSREDKQLVLNSIVKSDLNDLQQTDYLRRVHSLASEGFDTTLATFHMLDYKDFYAYLIRHSFEVKKGMAIIFMLHPISEELFLDKIIQRLETENNDEVKMALLECIWLTITVTGNDAVNKFSLDKEQPEKIRNYAVSLLNRKVREGGEEIKESIEELKELRRESLRGLSDEAIYEFYELTMKILAKSNG